MLRAVLLQFVVTLFVVAGAGLWEGTNGAVSAALGGAAIFLPNLLFALKLHMQARSANGVSPVSFFLGEIIKVGSTVLLLVLAAKFYGDLSWLALLLGLIAATIANLFAFLLKH